MTNLDERWAWRPVCAVAAVGSALLLALSGRYGYHGDELYFRLLAQRPALGYVDEGPVTPLLARACRAVFGDTAWALRVPGAVWFAALVVLAALLAREFGGGRAAQVLAAAGVATSGYPLLVGHLLLTTSLDLPLAAVVLLGAVRALKRDRRWWLLVGGAAGLATYNKLMICLLGLGLTVGLLAAGPRRVFRDRWLWSGVLLAVLLSTPNLGYQATHGWPELTMAGALGRGAVADNPWTFVPFHLQLLGPFLVPVAAAGVVTLWRDRTVRSLAVAYLAATVIVLATGGHVYYTAAFLMLSFTAGCPAAVRWARTRTRGGLLVAAVAVDAAVAALLILPVLPAGTVLDSPVPKMHKALRKQLGWEEFVAQVAAAYRALPAADRTGAVLLADNYGEAGALDRFGPAYGLPPVYSGHNELYTWGPPPAGTAVVLSIGADPRWLADRFAACTAVATIDYGKLPGEEEQGAPLLTCRGPQGGWAAVWPRFEHFG